VKHFLVLNPNIFKLGPYVVHCFSLWYNFYFRLNMFLSFVFVVDFSSSVYKSQISYLNKDKMVICIFLYIFIY